MKGKYANAAERRRYIEELEQRTSAAERERDRAIAELASLQDKHEQVTRSLRTQLEAIRDQRDRNTEPLLTAAEERVNALKAGADEAARDHEELEKKYHRLFDAAQSWLRKDTGCTGTEALEVLTAIVAPGKGGTLVTPDSGADRSMLGKPMEKIHALQRARGTRSGAAVEQRLEERFAEAQDSAE